MKRNRLCGVALPTVGDNTELCEQLGAIMRRDALSATLTIYLRSNFHDRAHRASIPPFHFHSASVEVDNHVRWRRETVSAAEEYGKAAEHPFDKISKLMRLRVCAD